ncbi:MAG: HEAT repeat domain-containing protein, partial [Deltaproteobacteria bacterium]|nr:HEAT repeat domain-containing protein [Deltaproteobacteria bacterium]
LTDKILSDYARLVLEQLNSTKADKAMCDALATTPDVAKIGILGSLGERRYGPAVGPAAKLIASSNTEVAQAAIQAIGRIGGTKAARHLSSMKPNQKLVRSQMQALVSCASSLSGSEAVVLYNKVIVGKDGSCRIAALRGLTHVDSGKAASYIINSVKSSDLQFRRGGLSIVAETKGRELTLKMLDLMDEFKGTQKAELIIALGIRGDKAALNRVLGNLSSNETPIRDAAINTVSRLGDASVIKQLLSIIDSPVLKASIVQAIAGMESKGVNAVLVESLKDRKLRNAAVSACIARNCTEATGGLLKLAADDQADVRKDTWAGLAVLANPDEMKSVMSVVVNIKTKQSLSYAERAVRKIFARAKDRSECFQVIASYYPNANEATKVFILGLGSESGDADTLKLEQSALASGNKKLYGQALRTLARWPNKLAVADLYNQAQNASGQVDRIIALRGYIRIAGLKDAGLSPQEQLVILKKAMKLASRNEEKKWVISNLQNVTSSESLQMLQKYMPDPMLRVEAQVAAASLISGPLNTLSPTECEAMAEVLIKSGNKTAAAKAQKILYELEKSKAYIMAWMISQTYSEKLKDGSAVFNTVYPPETDQAGVEWKPLTKGIGKEKINLGTVFGSNLVYTGIYVKTTLISPSAQTVRLEMGSNDGIKAWFNGELVHSNWKCGSDPGSDVAKVKLKKGKNEVLLKIVNETSGWEFSCRLMQENRKHVKGLTVQP